MHVSFVDLNGILIPPVTEPWKDDAAATRDKNSCNSMLSLTFDSLLFSLKCNRNYSLQSDMNGNNMINICLIASYV